MFFDRPLWQKITAHHIANKGIALDSMFVIIIEIVPRNRGMNMIAGTALSPPFPQPGYAVPVLPRQIDGGRVVVRNGSFA